MLMELEDQPHAYLALGDIAELKCVERMKDKTVLLVFVGDHMYLWPILTICSLKVQIVICSVLWGIGDVVNGDSNM